MSNRTEYWADHQTAGGLGPKAALRVIANYADEFGFCRIDQQTIAEIIEAGRQGNGDRSVRRYIETLANELRDAGGDLIRGPLLDVRKERDTDGTWKVSGYQLKLPSRKKQDRPAANLAGGRQAPAANLAAGEEGRNSFHGNGSHRPNPSSPPANLAASSSVPSSSSSNEEAQLRAWLGEHAEPSLSMMAAVPHQSPTWAGGVLGLYVGGNGREAMNGRDWTGVAPEARPRILSRALFEYASGGHVFNARFFAGFLRDVLKHPDGQRERETNDADSESEKGRARGRAAGRNTGRAGANGRADGPARREEEEYGLFVVRPPEGEAAAQA